MKPFGGEFVFLTTLHEMNDKNISPAIKSHVVDFKKT